MKTIFPSFILFTICMSHMTTLSSQQCTGSELYSKQSYLYGRFEVAMQSAQGNGIVSSFFLFNIQAGIDCNWPSQNNEIDVEMTGNNEQIYFTTHHPDPNQPWHVGDNFYLGFSPHIAIHDYAIEWEPGIVRWFVDDHLIYTQEDTNTDSLQYPMAIMINLWASDAVDWVGVWDPSVMPQSSSYDYIKFYQYTPGSGNYGTGNNFTFDWEDQFDNLDTSRWKISDFKQLGAYTTFRDKNVEIDNGKLSLYLKHPENNTNTVSVYFSVDMQDANLLPNDVVYLNGTFNNWCGTCEPMTKNGNIWSRTKQLSPNQYEYLFTVNGWEEVGNPPTASSCDYFPCDMYANYGVLISESLSTLDLMTHCWKECTDCTVPNSTTSSPSANKKLLRIFDVFGREIKEKPETLLFYLYDDGSVSKKVILSP